MRLQRLLLIFLAFYFTFLGGGSYYVLFFPVRVFHHFFVTLLLAGWLIGRWRQGKGLPETGLNTLIFAAVGVWILAAVFSLDPRMSFEHIWFGLLHVGMFFYIVDLIQRGYQRMVLEAAFFMAAGVIFLSGLELTSWFFGLGWLPGTDVGWLSSGRIPTLSDFPILKLALTVSTLLAGYAAPLVTLVGAWALTARQRDYRFALGAMTLCLAMILLLTSSRGGMLSLFAAAGTFALMQFVQMPRIKALIPPRVLLVGGAIILFIVGAGLVYITIPTSAYGSNEGRLDMWENAITLFRQDPFTGVGVGMFGRAFREVRNPSIAQDKLASAHNLYLNITAETGILGILVGLGFLGRIGQLTWQHWRSRQDITRRFRIQAVSAALIGVGVHSLVDVFSITPIVLLLLLLIAYAITPQPTSRLDPVPRGQRFTVLLALLLIVGYGVWFLQLDRAQAAYMASFIMEGNPEVALAKIHEAQELDPYLNLYRLQEAFILDKIGHTEAAITAYQTALVLEPTWDVGWLNLAALLENNGRYEEALAALENAQRYQSFNTARIHWARLAEATQSAPAEAIVEAYQLGIIYHFNVQLPLAAFWHETPLRLQALEKFTAQPFIQLDWQYRVWQVHDLAHAAALVPADPQTAAEWWIVGENALTVAQNAEAAQAAFSQAIQLDPTNGDYYVSRARATWQLDPAAALTDVQNGKRYGTRYESAAAVLALLTTDPDTQWEYRFTALGLPSLPQEFAAVLYGGRQAVFEVASSMVYPALSEAQLTPWLTLLAEYEQAGNENNARIMVSLLDEIAPYSPTVQALKQRYQEP